MIPTAPNPQSGRSQTRRTAPSPRKRGPDANGEDGQEGDRLIPAISDQEPSPEPATEPDEPDTDAGKTGTSGQTGGQATPNQPSQPEPPPQTEEPATTPTQADLEAQAEAQAGNGQYSLAAETLRQMEQLGYLTAAQLGAQLCSLADDALFDDENSIAAALYQESADLGNLDGNGGWLSAISMGTG